MDYRDILDLDLALPAEKVHEVADVAVAHINAAVSELRRLFLVEDLVDSLKFGVLLWCLTYVGSWFNGMTLIIIGKYFSHIVFRCLLSECEHDDSIQICLVCFRSSRPFHVAEDLRNEQGTDRSESGLGAGKD